jgi:hypothetical protein
MDELINTDLTKMGKRHGFLVFANRCDADVDGSEWLYDHHWRHVNANGDLVRIPLAWKSNGVLSGALFERDHRGLPETCAVTC